MNSTKTHGDSKDTKEERRPSSIFSFTASLALLIFLVLAFKDFILDANNIPSGSMVPTLKIGDYLFVNKMRYSVRIPFLGKEIIHIDDPQRGDIITFAPVNEKSKHYVKRVMAMPYDRIRIRDVSGCDLRKRKAKELKSRAENSKAKAKTLINKTNKTKEPPKKKSFQCENALGGLDEPIVSIIEYRPNDRGPWKRYPIEELSLEGSRKELIDSDNHGVLPPEYIKHKEYYSYSPPVLYREKVGQSEHLIVESAKAADARELCAAIYTKGCVVPPKHYFVMGDNRDYSKDSRIIGFIPRESIYGKAVIIYFSINWRDDICAGYWQLFRSSHFIAPFPSGFLLEDFPPEKQQAYCNEYDLYLQEQWDTRPRLQFVTEYIYHTLRYRIPRMSVRWQRPGTLID